MLWNFYALELERFATSMLCNFYICFATSMLWSFYALPVLYCLHAPSHCEFVTFVSKVRVPTKYLSAEALIMYATITQKSHAVLTIFTCTLQSGWVRSPGHAGTHCTHLCSWNQPWNTAVGYGGPFCCTLEVINGSSAWRNGLHTASCNSKKISQMV